MYFCIRRHCSRYTFALGLLSREGPPSGWVMLGVGFVDASFAGGAVHTLYTLRAEDQTETARATTTGVAAYPYHFSRAWNLELVMPIIQP